MHDITLIAEIRLLTTAAGGRKNPVREGYRPHGDFGGLYTSCCIFAPEGEIRSGFWLELGVPLICRVIPLWTTLVRARARVGQSIPLMEGRQVVGHMKILEIDDSNPHGPTSDEWVS
ncbi:MAG: hypothetical protein ABL908_18695 [Hyphomicrobium sp.]